MADSEVSIGYWKNIGLKVGLEIHQQLNTKHKLFCNCPTILTESSEKDVFERYLRPAMSELGEVDVAAYFEWKKGKKYYYHAPRSATCLVEADEEPPHELNREALEIVLGIAIAFGSIPVDEVHTMRKIVIDGSNTTGFQRTALVATGGRVVIDGKTYGIQTICLEEDAARKAGEEENVTEYVLDRLGIPLIEIATAPDIETPEEAAKVALWIGQMLRLTGKAKRGIGTIRQDLNISIRGGTKVEVKGVQDLRMLPKVIENEAKRQLKLLEISELLKKRGLKEHDIVYAPVDVTEALKNSKSTVVQKNLQKPNAKALAQKLPKMKGILGVELMPGRRFGTELADYARFFGDVKGLFHSDELPGYGITKEEVLKIAEMLGADLSADAFVVIVDEESKARKSILAVVDRIKAAFAGVPKETRMALPDGTTKFLRPQPGAARMYPETDVPPIVIDERMLRNAEKYVPQTPDAKKNYYMSTLGLSKALAEQMISYEKIDFFEELVEEFKSKVEPTTIASVLLITMPALKREGFNVDAINDKTIERVFNLLYENKIAKESIELLLKELSKSPEKDPYELAKELNLIMMTKEDVSEYLDKLVESNLNLIRDKREKAINVLMGKAMKELRGRAPGSIVMELLKEKVNSILAKEK